jgi:quercetin dioxygenase-like cupin family protein
MAIPHAAPGIPVDLQPQGEALSDAKTTALVKNDAFEAIRMVIPKGHEVCRNHQVEGPITVQCLAGRITFTADDDAHQVREGQWVFLPGRVPHTITGVEDSLVLLTVMFR